MLRTGGQHRLNYCCLQPAASEPATCCLWCTCAQAEHPAHWMRSRARSWRFLEQAPVPCIVPAHITLVDGPCTTFTAHALPCCAPPPWRWCALGRHRLACKHAPVAPATRTRWLPPYIEDAGTISSPYEHYSCPVLGTEGSVWPSWAELSWAQTCGWGPHFGLPARALWSTICRTNTCVGRFMIVGTQRAINGRGRPPNRGTAVIQSR